MRASSSFNAPRNTLGTLDPLTAARVLAAAADLTLILDAKGVVRDVAFRNQTLQGELGRTASWRGRPWRDTLTEESRPKMEALLADLLDGAGPSQRHLNHPSIDGPDVAIQYSAVRLREGEVVAFGSDLRPLSLLQQRLIDAQQMMERDYATLRQTEGRYRLLFEAEAEPLLILDVATGKVTEANGAARRLAGGAGRREAGWSFAALFESRSRTLVQRFLVAMQATGHADAVRARLAEGGRAVSVSATLLREDNAPLLLVRLSTVEGRAPLALSDLNARLLAALEQSPDPFVITGPHGEVLTANAAFADMAQLGNVGQVRGEPLETWLGREAEVLIANLRQRGSVRLFATRLRGAAGAETAVEVSAFTVAGDAQPTYGFALRDVSRRITAEPKPDADVPRSVEQLTELIGRVSLKELIRDATDTIERVCIESALELTGNNRAAASEMLGLSRQSLYTKLRRYGLGDLGDSEDE